MVEVTIVCLIYKSKQLAKAVYDSLYKHTPKLRNGEADLLFVANDPTDELVDYLNEQKYLFIINVNDHLTEKELFKQGYGAPEYMRRVYQGYNQGVLNASGKKVVLINSDNFFSDDWLENLLKYSDYKKVITSTLIEPGHKDFGVFPGAIQKDFGRTLDDYNDEGFQEFAAKISKTGYTFGGAYMPCLLYKDVAILAGLYPEGNIAGKSFEEIKRYGDEAFYDSLKNFGVEHLTAKDSVVYHLKEGEKSESVEGKKIVSDVKYKRASISPEHKVYPNNLMCYIKPEASHQETIDVLGNKFSVIISKFNNKEELNRQIEWVCNQDNKGVETIVLFDEITEKFIEPKIQGVRYVRSDSSKKDIELYKLVYETYGEYLLILNPNLGYSQDVFKQEYKKDKVNYIGANLPSENMINDNIGSFVVPKRIIFENVGFFLGHFLSDVDVEFELSQSYIIYVPAVEVVIMDEVKDRYGRYSVVIRESLPYRAAKKLYHDGPVGFIRAVTSKIARK